AGQSNKIYGEDSFLAGGIGSITSGDRNIGLGNKIKIPASDDGAMVLADGQSRDHFSSGEHTAVLDFINGVYITNDVFVAGDVEASEFIGDLQGAVSFRAKAGEALSAGEVVYISGINGNTTVVAKADADDPNKMPAFGVSKQTVNANANVLVANFGSVTNLDTSSYSEGDELFISDVAGQLTGVAPTGEASALQKMAKVTRSHASSGSITVMGAGRSNAVPNLNEGRLFVGNSSNKAIADGTIHVDIANSKVGIGTTTPNEKLTVSGNISAVSGTFTGKVTAEGGDSTKWNSAYTDRTPFSVITGTGGQTHIRYKSDGWLKSEINAIDTSFGASDIEAVIFGSEVPTIVNTILKAQVGLKFVDFGKISLVTFEACRGCTSLERVIMRASTQIGQSTFNGCSSLTDIDLGSVANIGFNAFKDCVSLTSVTIPASVTVLGNNVFHGCTSLSEVNCYANYSVFNMNVFLNTASPLTIHAKPNTGWTAASGISFQGNPNVTVILDLV
ncbi:leucine-rich repeat domain-containing protein, partial [Akkermansiaceae bacterium]|nr:leucine-rich repeat domain-containing protein [Akkermansiaceae bacterium]